MAAVVADADANADADVDVDVDLDLDVGVGVDADVMVGSVFGRDCDCDGNRPTSDVIRRSDVFPPIVLTLVVVGFRRMVVVVSLISV